MITLALILIPLIAALVVLLLKGETVKQAALGFTLVELAVAVFAILQFTPDATTQFATSYPWVASAGINFSIGMDGISLLLILLTTFVMPVIVLSTFRHDYKNPSSFYGLILLMQSALVGVFTAQDAFLFYLFWEAALIPVYFIAALWGGDRRIAVTFKFFIYTIFGSLFMLLALVYLYFQTTSTTLSPHSSDINAIYQAGKLLDAQTQGYIFWGLFIAFAIKMPVFPFHTWQPDTYTESPTPATMLLAGIMLKMGIYGVIRWLLPIVPAGVAEWSTAGVILSVIGIIYGAVIAIRQNDIKRLIAYSSFSHVGLMAAGVFSQNINGLQGAIIQMLAHGVNVVGLFFIIEIIARRTGTRDLTKLGGITQTTPALTVYFMILLLGSVALPLTSGFVGEFLLLAGVYEFNRWYGAVAGITIILGAVYLLRMFQGVMLGEQSDAAKSATDLTMLEKVALFPLIFMVFWIGMYPNFFLKLTEPAVQNLLTLLSKNGI